MTDDQQDKPTNLQDNASTDVAAKIRKVLNGYPYGGGNPWPLDLLTQAANALDARMRVIEWCRPRLKNDAYRATLDGYLAAPLEPDHTPIVQSVASTDVVEAVTAAIKEEFGKAFNAKPLTPGGIGNHGDWFASGDPGSIDLTLLARAAISTYERLRSTRAEVIEECAKVADEQFADPAIHPLMRNAAINIASAIRSLSPSGGVGAATAQTPPHRGCSEAEKAEMGDGSWADPAINRAIEVWFNAWLREPITARERVIIAHTRYAIQAPDDVKRANERSKTGTSPATSGSITPSSEETKAAMGGGWRSMVWGDL